MTENRKPHNHIFQEKKGQPDCEACESIFALRMNVEYGRMGHMWLIREGKVKAHG